MFVNLPTNQENIEEKFRSQTFTLTERAAQCSRRKPVGAFRLYCAWWEYSKSDIDILLDFNVVQETYPNFLIACQILEDNFKRNKLDVVTRKGLSPYIGQTILQEVEYV